MTDPDELRRRLDADPREAFHAIRRVQAMRRAFSALAAGPDGRDELATVSIVTLEACRERVEQEIARREST
jgi:hypothetical protein